MISRKPSKGYSYRANCGGTSEMWIILKKIKSIKRQRGGLIVNDMGQRQAHGRPYTLPLPLGWIINQQIACQLKVKFDLIKCHLRIKKWMFQLWFCFFIILQCSMWFCHWSILTHNITRATSFSQLGVLLLLTKDWLFSLLYKHLHGVLYLPSLLYFLYCLSNHITTQ